MDYKKAYMQMPETELVKFIFSEAHNLRPEAYNALNSVIIQKNLLRKIDYERFKFQKPISETEINELIVKVKNDSCPICNDNKIDNVVISSKAYGILIKMKIIDELLVGCKKCIKEKIKGNIIYTLVLGWMAIPAGIVIVPMITISNISCILQLRKNKPTEDFKKYVRDNRVEILKKMEST